jgi:predicted small lipoprotein YifL
MRHPAILLILALILAGCGPPGPQRLNPGASVAWIVANRHDLTAEYIRRGGTYAPNAQRQDGFYDRDAKEIWTISDGLDVRQLRRILAPALHEPLVHFIDDQGGDAQQAAARLSCPAFNLLYRDADPMAYATAEALRIANEAKP